MKTAKELTRDLMDRIWLVETISDEMLFPLINKFEKEIRKELNEFILDIAKLLPGSDGLGYDGLSWSIDDFKDAIKEVRKDQTIKCAEALKNSESSIFISDNTHDDSFIELNPAIEVIMNTIKEDE